MTNQPTPRCGLCDGPTRGTDVFGVTEFLCENPSCAIGEDCFEAEIHAAIRARRIEDIEDAFAAGILRSAVFKLGIDESLPSEVLTRLTDNYIAERFAEPKEDK